jgi:hypothetical protein
MRLVAGGPALEVSLKNNHPYSASDIGRPFGKTGAWIGKMINKEAMRDDPRYSRKHSMYANPIYSFSEAARARISKILAENPDYNPYC